MSLMEKERPPGRAGRRFAKEFKAVAVAKYEELAAVAGHSS